MKIRRFTATEMRSAMRSVREELGEDAVILSNRRTEQGVEIVAAIDYDEAEISQACDRAQTSTEALNHSDDRYANQTARQPSNRPANQPASQPASQPVSQPVSQTAGGVTGQGREHSSTGRETDNGIRASVPTAGRPRFSLSEDSQIGLPDWACESAPAGSARSGGSSVAGERSRVGYSDLTQSVNRPPAQFSSESSQDSAPRRDSTVGASNGWPSGRRPGAEDDRYNEAHPFAPANLHARELAGDSRDSSHGVERELQALRALLERQVSGLAWGDFGRRQPHRASLTRQLIQLGLTRAVADTVAARVQANGCEDSELGWIAALDELSNVLPRANHSLLEVGGVVALVGPTGVGKTTTIAKLAARFRGTHGVDSVALLTTDNYRVGAEAQLRIYGQLMGLPVAVCTHAEELQEAIERYGDRRLVLIDTAGMSQRDIRLAEQASFIEHGVGASGARVNFQLVLSAGTQYTTLTETMNTFRDVDLHGCMVTKVDEATSLGSVISASVERGLPITFTCDGQRVPEDLAQMRPKALVSRAVQFGQQAAPMAEEHFELCFGGIAAHA